MSQCLYCKELIAEGRKGKKFCNAYCKSSYHNERRKADETIVTEINRILRTNWRILSSLNPQGKSTVKKLFLIEQGYNFNYFTNIYRTQKGIIYYFCYDVGITEVSKAHVCIVNWQNYMGRFQHPISSLE